MPTPQNHLVEISKLYPRAWAQADDFRSGRAVLPPWPDWCFLPLAGWYSIVCAEHHLESLSLPYLNDMSRLAALGAWRPTQDIFRFEPELYDAVTSTPLDGDMPSDILLRLPAWCVYIETPLLAFGGEPLDGFFVHLEKDMNNGDEELRLLFAYQSGQLSPFPIHIGPWSLAEGLARFLQVPSFYTGRSETFGEHTGQVLNSLRQMINLVLYLCSDSPDMRSDAMPGVFQVHRPAPQKTKKGLRLFPPDKPRLWQVGTTIAARIQASHADAESRTGPSPHIRRAHWHGYWMGSRKTGTQRKLEFRWLPPIPVGGNKD